MMTFNMACRSGKLQVCDNCKVRFQEIANAIATGTNTTYLNLPDFDNIDIIVAQELFVEPGTELLNIIDEGMKKRGFQRVGVPGPNKDDLQCEDSMVPDGMQDLGSRIADLPNGGLATWTKLKVIDMHYRKWCFNVFPSYHGYTTAFLQKDDVNLLVFNSHFAPELPEFGENFQKFAQQIRSYQMSELKNEALALDKAFADAKLPYAVIFGGDSNEDAFGYENKKPDFKCDLLSKTPRVADFFKQIGLPDMKKHCADGIIGSGFTWDWTHNDIVSRSRPAYELLDYVTVMSKSGSPVTSQSPMTVYHLKKATPFAAEFCQDMVTGGTPMIQGTLTSLSDHDPVTANLVIPKGSGNSTKTDNELKKLFQDTVKNFEAQKAACGQEDMMCLKNSMCCNTAAYSFDGQEKGCYIQQGATEKKEKEEDSSFMKKAWASIQEKMNKKPVCASHDDEANLMQVKSPLSTTDSGRMSGLNLIVSVALYALYFTCA